MEDVLPAIERQLDRLVTAGYLSRPEADAQVAEYQSSLPPESPEEVYFTEYNQVRSATDRNHQDHKQLIDHARQFQVLLSPSVPEAHVQMVEDIVESEKPVYTDADVQRLQRRFLLDGHTYLGINTALLNDTFEVGESMLGQETRFDPAQRAESNDK